MATDLKLKLDIRLESLAGIAVAIRLWEVPGVQQKIQNYFWKPSEDKWKYRAKWFRVRNKVYNNVTSLELPDKITKELYQLVDLIGDKIFCWYEYVMINLGLSCKFARRIYWTLQGGIDEGKIFQCFWQNEPGFRSNKYRVNGFGTTLYMVACIFAQEEFIKKNLKDMTGVVNKSESTSEVYSVTQIISKWLKFYLGLTVESEVWLTASKEGLHMAVKYLPVPVMSFAAVAPIYLENTTRKYNSRYKKEKFIEIFLFTLNRMSVQEKIDFLFDNIKLVFNAFLKVWPYQTYFLQILNFLAKINLNRLKEIYPILLDHVIQTKRERNWCTPEIYKNIENCIFIKILEMLPKNLKKEILLNSEYNFCSRLFESSNYKILHFILNDSELYDVRDEIIGQGDQFLQMYAETFRFHEIDIFMDKTRLTKEEKKSLKNKFNMLSNVPLMSHYVKSGMLNELDKLLIWLSETESERVDLKKNINSSEIILFIFGSRLGNNFYRDWAEIDLGALDVYLKWQFDNEEERINFKLKLDLINFYRASITNVDSALVYKILNWQFGSDGEKLKEMKLKIGID